ncbi:MAG: type ISP restriction/modification enzyme [Hyphomonadaceae bacterium]
MKPGIGLVVNKKFVGDEFPMFPFPLTSFVMEHCISETAARLSVPLYLYPTPSELDQTRRVNFEPKIYAKLKRLAKHPTRGEPDEVAVFDYIYGVLHCPAYRETYAEFLKIDFPASPGRRALMCFGMCRTRAASSATCISWSSPPSAKRRIPSSAKAMGWWVNPNFAKAPSGSTRPAF